MPLILEKSVRLPRKARDALEQSPVLQTPGLVVEHARLGFTPKGEKIRLVRIRHPESPRWFFVSMDPTTHHITSSRTTTDKKEMCKLGATRADYTVCEGYKGRGIGSTVTAEAMAHAIRRGKGIGLGLFHNLRWQAQIEKMLGRGAVSEQGVYLEHELCTPLLVKGGSLTPYLLRKTAK